MNFSYLKHITILTAFHQDQTATVMKARLD